MRTLTPNFTVVALKMWAYRRQNCQFLVQICRKEVCPMKQFLPNLVWGRSSRLAPSCQISPLSLLKCGPTAPKIAKICIFGINLPKRGILPYMRFFTKFNLGKELQVPTIMPNFVVVALNCGFIAPKIAKNGNFWHIYICA